MVKILVHVYLLIRTIALSNQDAPELTIEQGTLRGAYWKTHRGRSFSGFNRIPYAEPPVGDLRFKPAVPAGPWTGVLDASKFQQTICPQINIFLYNFNAKGDEDCLYLNVYTPQLPDAGSKLLPVMFFIHGGAFICGHSDPAWFGPKILLDRDIVLVTANYRLGALGFLSTEDEVLPGNNGLKDQNLALKWTKKNIAHFGGDPEKITVFGQSAGGASAHFHVLSPLSKDLMQGAIAQSGVATAPWALAPKGEALRSAKRLAEFLSCPIESSQEMLECLSKVDAYDIVNQDLKFMEWSYDPIVPFKPVVEPDTEGAFITEHPVDIIKSGKAANIPFITGITTQDGCIKSASIYDDSKLEQEFSHDFDRILPIILQYEAAPNRDNVTRRIREFYLGDRTIDTSAKADLTDLFTDAAFLFPQNIALELHAQYSQQPIYAYMFGYRGTVSFSVAFGDPKHDYGVCHADDLLYLLSNHFFGDYRSNEADKKITDIMTTLWANFASTGNPTPDTNSLIPAKWEPVQSNSLKYYLIKGENDVGMDENRYLKRAKFWEELAMTLKV